MTRIDEFDGQEAQRCFVLSPNCSSNWRENQLFLLLAAGPAGIIAALCFWQGLYMVVPFTGLELMALGVCLYLVSLRSHSKELIQINDDRVSVAYGYRAPVTWYEFPRGWVRVWLEQPVNPGHQSRLWIGASGRQVMVGGFLQEEERIRLGRRLQMAVAR